jgi:hypothetical protein
MTDRGIWIEEEEDDFPELVIVFEPDWQQFTLTNTGVGTELRLTVAPDSWEAKFIPGKEAK